MKAFRLDYWQKYGAVNEKAKGDSAGERLHRHHAIPTRHVRTSSSGSPSKTSKKALQYEQIYTIITT
jgi:hypothetical protein